MVNDYTPHSSVSADDVYVERKRTPKPQTIIAETISAAQRFVSMETTSMQQISDIIRTTPELSEYISVDISNDDFELEMFFEDALDSHNDELVVQIAEMLEIQEPPLSSKHHIYMVPEKIRNLNEKAYSPRVISIGPFHHKTSERLKSMDTIKIRYFRKLIARSNIRLRKYVQIVKGLEERARECYAETIGMSSNDFVSMMLTDACFIIELLLRSYYYHMNEDNEYPLSTSWLRSDIRLDLMLLENQIPFFVLDEIFVQATTNLSVKSLNALALHFFKKYNINNIGENCGIPLHFTDLILIMSRPNSPRLQPRGKRFRSIYSATELREAGVKFQGSTSKCLLDIVFNKDVLTIPCFRLNDHTEIFIRNLMALEFCHFPNNSYIIDYIMFMDYLVDTSNDIELLIKKGIIVNGLGESNVAADLFNNLCKNVTVDHHNFYLSRICEDLNAYYRKPMHK